MAVGRGWLALVGGRLAVGGGVVGCREKEVGNAVHSMGRVVVLGRKARWLSRGGEEGGDRLTVNDFKQLSKEEVDC